MKFNFNVATPKMQQSNDLSFSNPVRKKIKLRTSILDDPEEEKSQATNLPSKAQV